MILKEKSEMSCLFRWKYFHSWLVFTAWIIACWSRHSFKIMSLSFFFCICFGYCGERQDCSSAISLVTKDFRHIAGWIRQPLGCKMEQSLGNLLDTRIGVWECDTPSLGSAVSTEWETAHALYLQVRGVNDVNLWIEKRTAAVPSYSRENGFLTDRSIFVARINH